MREARIGVGAFLKAERDRMAATELDQMYAREADIMKDRKDWVVGENVFSKRWLPPTKGLGN